MEFLKIFHVLSAIVAVSTAAPNLRIHGLVVANRVLDSSPVVDGHNDFAHVLRIEGEKGLGRLELDSCLEGKAHTDLARLKKGKVGGQFWSAYIGCESQHKDAIRRFLGQMDVIKRFVERNGRRMTFVTRPSQLRKAFVDGKVGSMIGVESGHAISSDMAVLRTLYDLGASYMTLTHGCNTPWADSEKAEGRTLDARSNGLSKFGKKIVREMNRLGMMVDLSHVSHKTMLDSLNASTAPVIFSHSSARSVLNHTRNVPDDVLKRMPGNGGIVMVNFYSCFIVKDCATNNGTVDDVAKHIDHIKKVAGADHVAIGADYDGVVEMPNGLEDVSKYPFLLAHLFDEYGWTEEELAKLASDNLLRVWEAVEAEGIRLRTTELASEEVIPLEDFKEDETNCMTGRV